MWSNSGRYLAIVDPYSDGLLRIYDTFVGRMRVYAGYADFNCATWSAERDELIIVMPTAKKGSIVYELSNSYIGGRPYGFIGRLATRTNAAPGHVRCFSFTLKNNMTTAGDSQLCHRVDFLDRLPGVDDIATLGMIRVSDGEFITFAETKAWNFQQGSMLQWLPGDADKQVIYNMRSDDNFIGVIKYIDTGK